MKNFFQQSGFLFQVATLLLCCYGFLKEIRPSEPFLTDYLLGNSSGITQDELYHEVYPIWTYSYLGFLVLVFLFTDLTRWLIDLFHMDEAQG